METCLFQNLHDSLQEAIIFVQDQADRHGDIIFAWYGLHSFLV